MTARRFLILLTLGVLTWSGIGPFDRATWWMEVVPVMIALPILMATHRRFPLTLITLTGLTFFGVILMVGGHTTYARVPIGFWVQDAFDLSRNHFDRFGHFFQGFVPALLVRELLLRTSPLRRGAWLFFLVSATALAISASYELIEWLAAILGGEAATDFLGTQGDVWDTQWDMFLALCGSILAQLTLARWQDRQMASLPNTMI